MAKNWTLLLLWVFCITTIEEKSKVAACVLSGYKST
jgi:hypothetical protein